MNSQFVRTFADDLEEVRKEYYNKATLNVSVNIKILESLSELVIKLHYLSNLLEKEEMKD